jgi:hypothetical protein
MLSCARLVLEVVIWSARTGIDRLTVHRFLNKFHHGQDVNQHQSKVNVGEELQLLGAYDYSLMDRCGANRLDEIQLSMLLACVVSEDSRASAGVQRRASGAARVDGGAAVVRGALSAVDASSGR